MLKNVTLSIDESILGSARKKAMNDNKTLNQLFRDWVTQYLGLGVEKETYKKIIQDLKYAKPGKKFSRDELNER